MNIQDSWKRHHMVHLSWIIAVLGVMVIILGSKDFSAVPDLKDILSFAVSFASFTLAVFAIGQAAFSSSSSSSTLSAINIASQKLESLASNLNEVSLQISDSVPKLLASTISLEEKSSVMMASIERRDQKSVDGLSRVGNGTDIDNNSITNGSILSFYFLFRAYESNNSVRLSQFGFESDYVIELFTSHAHLLHSMDKITVTFDGNEMKVKNVSGIDYMKEVVFRLASKSNESGSDPARNEEMFRSVRDKIDHYFGITNSG